MDLPSPLLRAPLTEKRTRGNLLCPHGGLLLLGMQTPQLPLETVMSRGEAELQPALLWVREGDGGLGVEGTKNWGHRDQREERGSGERRDGGCWA